MEQHTRRKKWLWLLVTATCALGFLYFNQQTAHAEPTYTIGTGTTFEPYEIESKDGSYDGKNNGIDMDILKAIAKKEHFKYKLKVMGFNAQLQAVQAGQIDGMMAGVSVTDARKATFDFSTPYYNAGEVMAVDKNSKIKSFKDLKGKTVALKAGTTGAIYGESLQKKYDFKIKYFNDSNTMWNDVHNGGTVATFDDGPVLEYGILNGVPLKIVTKPAKTTPVAFAVKKGENQELLHKFNAGLASIKKSGELKQIINKYLNGNAVKTDTASQRTIMGLIKNNKGTLLSGLWMTIELAVLGIICATVLGVILGVMGISDGKALPWTASTITYIFRGLPMMVLAFFIYIGMPDVIGQKIPLFTAGIITLTLNEGAYIGAFVKGGFKAVDREQWEAARSLGLPYNRALWKVIAPQGIKFMIPSFINQFIITLKDTSILSAIGVMELTETGTVIISKNMEGFKVWAIIAVMYLVVITLLTWLSNYVQKRMRV
ncbi:ABC transporter substrate-binding protein/permease [Paucilactobacillus wasatchensis]|uniref:Glutamine transport system permease protein n=1 Tax=Paucilactobacillus wasatchensis TaxID=1335616 RepID=A0A0D0YYT0_9LACO|nr:ABC transporter substrate-binding protein/permease [Paucilactobacillus wasatchensis]KIS04384.1 Glutamine transport system permease protein [Paucilactobacillus wasatchensis]